MPVASRYLLPLELLMSLQAIAWAISGGFGGGALHQLLAPRGENLTWFFVLGGTGFVMLALTSIEWVYGRHWPLPRLLAWVSARAVAAFLMAVIWTYALFVVIVLDRDAIVYVLIMMAPVNGLFSWWSYVENLKVRYALDHRQPTQKLRFHR